MSEAPGSIRSGRVLALALTAALALAALAAAGTEAAATTPALTATGSARQVYATGLAPATPMQLLDKAGTVVAAQNANSLGGILFRDVAPGGGYRVRRVADGALSPKLTVHSESAAQWNPSIYQQSVPSSGYGYLTTRDGTKLAYSVHPPTSPTSLGIPTVAPLPNLPTSLPFAPPYPTLIEYSGYGYANPSGPTSGIAVLANIMGFAVVDINMRGTGCSGGAFDFFEPLQSLDGYDIVETIARQPWVKNHQVGMMGISYGGISQLFTARLQPPSLAAISPLSVLDATATTLYPGGILNTGFAVAWANERQHEALPAGPDAGQSWAWDRIQNGDTTCAADQVLHASAADLNAKIATNSHYDAAVADPLDPVTFVNKIKVPTFLACQWQDEQTGGHCPELVRKFTGTSQKWFTFTNGAHIDSLDPDTYNRWYDFLQLFVARQAPIQNSAITRAAAPVIYQQAMGLPPTDLVTLPVDPIQLQPTYDLALAAFNALPRVRVLFDNGAGKGPLGTASAGDPYAGYAQDFAALPVAGTQARTWYLGAAGTLNSAAPVTGAVDAFTADAHALPATDFGAGTGSGGLWGNASQWSWNWQQPPAGTRGVVRDRAAHREHHRRRQRRGVAVGEVVDTRRRPAGDDQRDPTRWQRGLRAERLAARQRAEALDRREEHVQAAEHRARARAHLHGGRRGADAVRPVREAHRAALLRGARVPRRFPHPGDDLRAQRHAADLGVRPGVERRAGVDRVVGVDAVEPGAAGRARGGGAHRTPAVREPAQRALPGLPADRQRAGLTHRVPTGVRPGWAWRRWTPRGPGARRVTGAADRTRHPAAFRPVAQAVTEDVGADGGEDHRDQGRDGELEHLGDPALHRALEPFERLLELPGVPVVRGLRSRRVGDRGGRHRRDRCGRDGVGRWQLGLHRGSLALRAPPAGEARRGPGRTGRRAVGPRR